MKNNDISLHVRLPMISYRTEQRGMLKHWKSQWFPMLLLINQIKNRVLHFSSKDLSYFKSWWNEKVLSPRFRIQKKSKIVYLTFNANQKSQKTKISCVIYLQMADYGGKPTIHHINMVMWSMSDIIGVVAYGSCHGTLVVLI